MLINKKIVFAAAAVLALGTTSCRKLLDVNTNPAVAQSGTVQTLLPAGQLYLGSAVGTDLQVNGSIFSQYWTQTPAGRQFVAIDQNSPSQDAFNTPWTNLYAAAENFYQVYKLADAQNKRQYKAIALLMQAYTFQLITDAWGDVPFAQALRAQHIDSNIVNPRYDSQRVVYNGILAYIDSANKLLNTADPARPGADDLIYGGNMTRWKKFSNTLKLKVLLRMAYVDPVNARAEIDTLYMSNPQFIGQGDDARIQYNGTGGNRNPLFAELSAHAMGNIQHLGASSTAVDSMDANNDYRLAAFYKQGATGYTGIRQGAYDVALPTGAYATPSAYVGADAQNSASANAPVHLLTSWESYFLQAEAVARGWAPATVSDQDLFISGIRASFNYYGNAIETEMPGVDADSAFRIYTQGNAAMGIAPARWSMYPTGGSVEDKLRFIITQKWFAMNGNQGFEAWTELRRTGYPNFLVRPKNSLIGNSLPARFLYPATESTRNTSFPGLQAITARVWWDRF